MNLSISAFALSVALLLGCSSSEKLSGPSDTSDTESEFEDRWVLTDYTLDDGTMKSVPNSIQDEGGAAIVVSSAESMGVQSGLCDYYQISYLLDNEVLTTSDPVSPATACAGFYADADNAERSELMGRTFFNSQTLIVVSGNLLTVTTMQNEQLSFKRSALL